MWHLFESVWVNMHLNAIAIGRLHAQTSMRVASSLGGYDVNRKTPGQVDTFASIEGLPHEPLPVRRLVESIMSDHRIRHISTAYLPDRDAVVHILEQLRWLMFPGFFGPRNL